MKITNALFLFVPLCFASIIQSAAPYTDSVASNTIIFENALELTVSHKNYEGYTRAIGNPTIAEKWLADLSKRIPSLSTEDFFELAESVVHGFSSWLNEIDPKMFEAIPDDVFSEDTPVLSESQRARARLQHCKLLILSQDTDFLII